MVSSPSIVTPRTDGPQAAYKDTVPPPPTELCHDIGSMVEHILDGTSVYYYKIKYNRDLRIYKMVSSPVATDFQKLYGHLKASDPKLLLVPLNTAALEPESQDRSIFPYINHPVEIPINSEKEFRNYLSYTIEREQANCVVIVQTTKQFWMDKEDAGVQN